MAVEPDTARRLLGAFRAIVNGTVSSSTPPVPAAVALYLRSERGELRPLGEVRQILLSVLAECGRLTPSERATISLYYGLDLVPLPMTARGRWQSVVELLPSGPRRTGRPRTGDEPSADVVTYTRDAGIAKLAATMSSSPGDADVHPRLASDPLVERWYRSAIGMCPPADRRLLLRVALHDARRRCALVPAVQSERWLELDWWAYRRRDKLGMPHTARPHRRINNERFARGCAHVSIALWDLLRDDDRVRRVRQDVPRGKGVGYSEAEARIDLVTGELCGELYRASAGPEAFEAALLRVEEQERVGLSSPDVALSAAVLGSALVPSLPDQLVLKAAQVLTRASADHDSLDGLGRAWLNEVRRRCLDTDDSFATATLDASVSETSHGRYPEAYRLLSSVAIDNPQAALRVEVGQSALRRRLVQDLLARRVPFKRPDVEDAVHVAIGAAAHAVELAMSRDASYLLSSNEASPHSELLRSAVRLAEAIAIGLAAVEADAVGPEVGRAIRTLGLQRLGPLADLVGEEAERREALAMMTRYDRARLATIRACIDAYTDNRGMRQFDVRRRISG